MVFTLTEGENGNVELILDNEGIDYLEDGLTELRRMRCGESVSTPSITDDGVSDFVLKRVDDAH
jgi:hypothetical protein